jgi:Carboxypeptidase regulatory-like domain/TonB-dependent Receptor Plug Domain
MDRGSRFRIFQPFFQEPLMTFHRGALTRVLLLTLFLVTSLRAHAQAGAAGSVSGTITDPTGAVIPNATVELQNSMSGFSRTITTGADGQFQFTNVPFNPYAITASAKGFAPMSQTVEIRSAVGINLKLVLHVGGASQTVTVESAGPLIEDTSTYHTDIDRDMFIKVPIESQSSSLSSLVTMTTPGVSADSNGLFHGLGDHASNSFSIDGQPITDQQSKVFSNQLPSNAVQSLEVIEGAPPAQYGDKTSLVIVATTRSGQGVTTPTGSIYASYGAFGSGTGGFNISYGGKSWGNFYEMDGLDTGRFLDPPEFTVFHDKGNEENLFDHADYDFNQANSLHLDLNYSRSWFQTPNSFDNLNVQNVVSAGTSANPVFASVGNTDQRSKIDTFNIAPTYTRVISPSAVFNLGLYARKDDYDYFPSNNPLADLGPSNLQTSSISQYRTLTNLGAHADYTYAKGIQNLLIGAQYEQTFLREHDSLGIVDNTYNSPCVDSNGNAVPGFSDPSQCAAAGYVSNDPSNGGTYDSLLLPYDLTRGGTSYLYFGRTDVKELALYIEDQIKVGNWHYSLGLREDVYSGLTDANQTEPRVGVAYRIQPSKTVLGISYARTLETPFNENLVLSSNGCTNDVLAPLLLCTPGVSGTMQPGFRNEFHADLQQALGKYFVFSGEYIWKYTHNAFDFSVLGNTPITFPIDWHNSKIPGYALHLEVPNFHNISAYTVMSSVAARFFPPQSAGAGATVQGGYPFRIDHDEKYNQTTHFQYTLPGSELWSGMWMGFNWRYDSGLVAGSVPCYGVTDPNSLCAGTSITLPGGQAGVDLSGLTYDQQFEAGITCNGVTATPTSGFTSCPASEYTSSLVQIPAPNTEDDDHNPPRIAPRSLFDLSVGKNNIFHADKYKVNLDLTAINIADKYALYNFLSTFSGTHYVTPRALTAKVTFNF